MSRSVGSALLALSSALALPAHHEAYAELGAYAAPVILSRMATTFTVLAEPARRRILDLLLERPRPVGELVDRLGLTQPGTSKHLRVLREAGLVVVTPEAQKRVYALNPEPLAELDEWLEPYRRLWSGRLDALERHLDATRGDGDTG